MPRAFNIFRRAAAERLDFDDRWLFLKSLISRATSSLPCFSASKRPSALVPTCVLTESEAPPPSFMEDTAVPSSCNRRRNKVPLLCLATSRCASPKPATNPDRMRSAEGRPGFWQAATHSEEDLSHGIKGMISSRYPRSSATTPAFTKAARIASPIAGSLGMCAIIEVTKSSDNELLPSPLSELPAELATGAASLLPGKGRGMAARTRTSIGASCPKVRNGSRDATCVCTFCNHWSEVLAPAAPSALPPSYEPPA
mmetsp:Transcript_119421/g.380895  ORF Transcript_119421/g.380895 Transcript_119421/m.380895 type:complete len:255 (-) Transcript_119421:2829-3593(-)